MARQPDIQYVRFYTSGSAARKIELERRPSVNKPQTQNQARPKVRRDQRKVIRIDPISVCAMLVAGVMLIAMAIGMIKLGSINSEANRMEAYVAELRQENAQLQSKYESSYDLTDVEQKAQEMGMVPAGKLPQIQLQVTPPAEEPTLSAWEQFKAFMTELFA